LLLVGAGIFLLNTGIIQGHLLTMNERPFFNMVRLISLHGSKERYLLTNLARSKFGVPSCLISFLSCLSLQCQRDVSISAELRQVAKGFDYKVSSFNAISCFLLDYVLLQRLKASQLDEVILN
jgi:hypothetical protein